MSGVVEYPVWDGREWTAVSLPAAEGSALVVPNVAAVVWRGGRRDELLLQRRDKPGEPVRGCLELPGGRWQAGEDPAAALRREVGEETGLDITDAVTGAVEYEAQDRRPFTASQPLVVTVGTGGAFPALHVVYECAADGEPRPEPGETSDPRWYSVAEVRELLADPAQFTGPSYAVLRTVLG